MIINVLNDFSIIILISIIGLTKGNAEIKDSLFATVGNRAITDSDVVNEVKLILILNNQSYSEENREQLHKIAISTIVPEAIPPWFPQRLLSHTSHDED